MILLPQLRILMLLLLDRQLIEVKVIHKNSITMILTLMVMMYQVALLLQISDMVLMIITLVKKLRHQKVD